ncbi:MAG: hypothetical protein IIU88_02725, partial [Clostridia bacterium]|nr:hypothetical protein [Clostridia bacterium]
QVEGAEPSSPSADGETFSRPFSFCQAFSFGPTWAKEKAEVTGFAFCAVDKATAISPFSPLSHFSL